MLNQKTLREHKNAKTILRDSCLDPPKSEESENQKNLGKTKKQKNNSGEVLRKKGSSQESLRIVFFGFPSFFLFFWIF